jgi:hypothetical protein
MQDGVAPSPVKSPDESLALDKTMTAVLQGTQTYLDFWLTEMVR